MSPPAPAQPLPDKWVRLKPRIPLERHSYPPGAAMGARLPGKGLWSGLKDTMPNGATGPGKTLPPFVVPMKGFTS
jgi:hypothetical protein